MSAEKLKSYKILCILIRSWMFCWKIHFTVPGSALLSLNRYAPYGAEVKPRSWKGHNVYVSATPSLLDNCTMATITPYAIICLSFTTTLIATRCSVSWIPHSLAFYYFTAERNWTQHESSAQSNPLMSYKYVWSWFHPVLRLLLNLISRVKCDN